MIFFRVEDAILEPILEPKNTIWVLRPPLFDFILELIFGPKMAHRGEATWEYSNYIYMCVTAINNNNYNNR